MNGELNGVAALILMGAGMLLGMLATMTWAGLLVKRERARAERAAWGAASRFYALKGTED